MSTGSRLRGGVLAMIGLGTALVGCLGCESAHYVIRGPDRGVVAIPEDTPAFRAKAEKLMHEQFPGGYVLDDVRVVAIGRPYHTVVQVGPFAEVEEHQRHEVMLYYHSGQALPTVPAPALVTRVAAPPSASVAPVQPASLTVQPPLPDGLPPQPEPVR